VTRHDALPAERCDFAGGEVGERPLRHARRTVWGEDEQWVGVDVAAVRDDDRAGRRDADRIEAGVDPAARGEVESGVCPRPGRSVEPVATDGEDRYGLLLRGREVEPRVGDEDFDGADAGGAEDVVDDANTRPVPHSGLDGDLFFELGELGGERREARARREERVTERSHDGRVVRGDLDGELDGACVDFVGAGDRSPLEREVVVGGADREAQQPFLLHEVVGGVVADGEATEGDLVVGEAHGNLCSAPAIVVPTSTTPTWTTRRA
jgi:hypothetical protein